MPSCSFISHYIEFLEFQVKIVHKKKRKMKFFHEIFTNHKGIFFSSNFRNVLASAPFGLIFGV